MIRRLLFNLKRRLELRKLKPDMGQVELARYKFITEGYVVEAESYLEWVTAAKMLALLLDRKIELYIKDGKYIWRRYHYIYASRYSDVIECTSVNFYADRVLSFERFSELYLISGKEVKLRNYEHLL